MKIMVDEEYAVQRLKELQEWADYIVESLTVDQGFETGKLDSLKRLIDEPSLQELQQAAWVLREKLNRAVDQSEGRVSPGPTIDRIVKVG